MAGGSPRCALVASATPTESADAFVRSSPPTVSIQLDGSRGYPIEISLLQDFATIRVAEPGKRKRSDATAEYVDFDGRVTVDGAEASFGRFGKVAVRFVPSSREKRAPVPELCEGKPKFTRFGTFVGKIGFRGEGGYTEVDLSRAKGTVRATPRQTCQRQRTGAGPPEGRDTAGRDGC